MWQREPKKRDWWEGALRGFILAHVQADGGTQDAQAPEQGKSVCIFHVPDRLLCSTAYSSNSEVGVKPYCTPATTHVAAAGQESVLIWAHV